MRTLQGLAYDKIVETFRDVGRESLKEELIRADVPPHLVEPDPAFLSFLPSLPLHEALERVGWVASFEAQSCVAANIFSRFYPAPLFLADVDATLFLCHRKVCMQYCRQLLPKSREDFSNALMRRASDAYLSRHPEKLSLKNLLHTLQQTLTIIDRQFPDNDETRGVRISVNVLFRRAQLPYLYYLGLQNQGINYGEVWLPQAVDGGAPLSYLDGEIAAETWY